MRTKHERLEPLLFRVRLHRIRGRTLRTETLDRSCARNVKRSEDDFGKWTPFLLLRVRLHRIRGRTLRTETLDRSDVRNVIRSANDSGSGRQSCEPEFNYTGYETSRLEMDRWTGIPKAAETAVRIFRETHAISVMTSSTTQDTRHRA